MKNREIDRETASNLFAQLWEMGAIGSHELREEYKKLTDVHGLAVLQTLPNQLQEAISILAKNE
jgi:hypothetical protein